MRLYFFIIPKSTSILNLLIIVYPHGDTTHPFTFLFLSFILNFRRILFSFPPFIILPLHWLLTRLLLQLLHQLLKQLLLLSLHWLLLRLLLL